MIGLVIIAVVAGLAGAFSLTQATFGVGLICGGCLFGILARVAQASVQHDEVMAMLQVLQRSVMPPSSGPPPE
jgi:hypothetical protein